MHKIIADNNSVKMPKNDALLCYGVIRNLCENKGIGKLLDCGYFMHAFDLLKELVVVLDKL